MKIFKYELKDISAGVHINDIGFFLFERMKNCFTLTILELTVHTFGEDTFYFIADQKDQFKMIEIFTNIQDLKYFGEFETSFKDVTDEIINNIDEFDSVENFNDRNTLLEYYYKIYTPDKILDKILDKGVDSLSKHDKIILDESVKYK